MYLPRARTPWCDSLHTRAYNKHVNSASVARHNSFPLGNNCSAPRRKTNGCGIKWGRSICVNMHSSQSSFAMSQILLILLWTGDRNSFQKGLRNYDESTNSIVSDLRKQSRFYEHVWVTWTVKTRVFICENEFLSWTTNCSSASQVPLQYKWSKSKSPHHFCGPVFVDEFHKDEILWAWPFQTVASNMHRGFMKNERRDDLLNTVGTVHF